MGACRGDAGVFRVICNRSEGCCMNLYSKLYDIVEANSKQSGSSVACPKEALLFVAQARPGICDGKSLDALDNREYLYATFMTMCNRLPDDELVRSWESKMKSDEKTFREAWMDMLLRTPERFQNHAEYRNNTTIEVIHRGFCESEADVIPTEQPAQSKPGLKDKAYACYLKLPASLRGSVHKLVRGNNEE